MIPVISISLENAADRRAFVTDKLGALNIPFRFFDAVDGKQLSQAEVKALNPGRSWRRFGAKMLPGELGCLLSFKKVCEQIAIGPDEFACVMEDDVLLHQEITEMLDEATLKALPHFDVLRPYDPSKTYLPVATYKNYTLTAPYRPAWSTHVQIISRSGARKIARAIQNPQVPVDSVLYYDGHVKGLRILEITPAMRTRYTPLAEQTYIDPGRTRAFPIIPTSRWPIYMQTYYEKRSEFRVWRNFVRLWGFSALKRLQKRA